MRSEDSDGERKSVSPDRKPVAKQLNPVAKQLNYPTKPEPQLVQKTSPKQGEQILIILKYPGYFWGRLIN